MIPIALVNLKKNKKSFKNVLTFQKLNDIINM